MDADIQEGGAERYGQNLRRAFRTGRGTVETDKRTYLAVACADGRIVVDELQIAGKRRMSARDLLPGMRDLSDYSFGEEAAEA